MKILPLGLDYSTGAPLLAAQDEAQFAGNLIHSMTALPDTNLSKGLFRGPEVHRPGTVDLGDVNQAGWTYLVNDYDPNYEEIVRILRPLALQRGMKTPDHPLRYKGQRPEAWFSWILDNLTPTGIETPPLYILIVANPEQVPFHFQSFLSASFAVGRLDFDTLENLGVYVDKILTLEKLSQPIVQRRTFFLHRMAARGTQPITAAAIWPNHWHS